jgi:hypothetical protein
MSRVAAILAAVVAVLLIAGAIAVFTTPVLIDPNRQSAINAVQQAGVKPGVTPGPSWEKP